MKKSHEQKVALINIKAVFLILIAVSFSACKRNFIELPEESAAQPIFETQFSINGETVNFVAGVDDYYMHTNYQADNENVLRYLGHFAEEGCQADCPSSIQFELRSTQFADETTTTNDLMVKDYEYMDLTAEDADVYQVKLDANIEEENLDSFFWGNLGGNNELKIVNQASYIHNYTVDSENRFDPILRVLSTNGHEYSLSRNVPLNGGITCSADLSMSDNNDGTYTAEVITQNINDATYFWLDDNSNGNMIAGTDLFTTSFTAPIDSFLQWSIGLLVFDGIAPECNVGITSTFSQDANGNLAYASANYDHEVLAKIENGSRYGFSQFVIQYTDENGTTYRSDLGPQSALSYLKVTSIEDYISNENSQATKKLDIQYQCNVYTETGLSLRVVDGTGTIAVAYPN